MQPIAGNMGWWSELFTRPYVPLWAVEGVGNAEMLLTQVKSISLSSCTNVS
jgi:hypothetical protein